MTCVDGKMEYDTKNNYNDIISNKKERAKWADEFPL